MLTPVQDSKRKKAVIQVANVGKISGLDFYGVELLDNRLEKQFSKMLETYLSIPIDSLLHGFRTRYGIDAPGKSIDGWYGDDIFNAFGQYLQGFARMYAATGNTLAIDRAVELMTHWSKTIEDDGYFFHSNKIPKATHYFYDKMMGGLCDIYRMTGNPLAVECMKKITKWAVKNLDTTNPYGQNALHSPTEWYTLSENLYIAYTLTGDEEYRKFGDVFLYHDYYNFFLCKDFNGLMDAGDNCSVKRYHAYSHVNSLSGAAMAYRLTGDSKYLQILTNAFDMLTETQLFITGGYGISETFIRARHRSESLYSNKYHFEVACCSWAVFKLCRYLTEFTGEAKYADWSEKMIYNGIGAALPISDKGGVMYFAQYGIKGAKKELMWPWSCCTGTYPLSVTDYYNQIYFHSNDTIYVAQYLSSKLNLEYNGKSVQIVQNADLIGDKLSHIKILCESNVTFKLMLRVPGWCTDGVKVSINGIEQSCNISNNRIVIDKEWQNSDEIVINFPFEVTLSYMEDPKNSPIAFSYGPAVLVLKGENRDLTAEELHSFKFEKSVSGQEVQFKGVGRGSEISLDAYYSVEADVLYQMYFDPYSTIIPAEKLEFGPRQEDWENKEDAYHSTGYRSYFRFKFNGRGFRWVGQQLENGSNAKIFVDGKLKFSVDQYGLFDGIPWMKEVTDLDSGEHEVLISVDNEANSYSGNRTAMRGCNINVSHISIIV